MMTRKRLRLRCDTVASATVLCLVLLCGCGSSTSNSSTGQEKHYIFITSLTYQGDLKSAGGSATGLAGADKICTNAGAASGIGGSWKAWLSDSATNAIDRITDVGPWYLVGTDTMVFANKANLTTTPRVQITISEDGTPPSLATSVWTGTQLSGTKTSSTCQDWTTSSTASGTAGLVQGAGDTTSWTDSRDASCGTSMHLYCIQQ